MKTNSEFSSVREVVLGQRRELDSQKALSYIARTAPAPDQKAHNLIQVILGPRRAGKSSLALHWARELGTCGYINFDDERLLGVTNADDIINAIDEVYGKPSWLLIDEIQNFPGWELLLNRLQREGRQLLVTGSNSNLLSTELASHLTGRHLPTVLFPFSFAEYIRCRGAGPFTESEYRAMLDAYTEEGGFPEPLLTGVARQDYLRMLVQSILYKDIVRRFSIRAVQGLEDLAHYLFSNTAKEYSFQTLAKMTRCRAVRTVEKYMKHLEDAFLFFSIKRFSFKVREQVGFNKKIYCIDNGMALALGFRFSSDTGRLVENLVAVTLRRRELQGEITLYFWRNEKKEEVDFVIRKGTTITSLIQVCIDVADPHTLQREMRALLHAGRDLKCEELLILTRDTTRKEAYVWFGTTGIVKFVPLWKWLLEP